MPYTTAEEMSEQKIAHIIHELWTGHARHNWRKTLKTLRQHYMTGWDRQAATALVSNNIGDAIKTLEQSGEIIDYRVRSIATNRAVNEVIAMFLREGIT